MVEGINGFGVPPVHPDAPGSAQTPPAGSPNFKDVLFDSINQVNQLQADAQQMVEGLATGQNDNQAQVMTAVQKADLAFRSLMQIRNKLTDAYEQIQQMRV